MQTIGRIFLCGAIGAVLGGVVGFLNLFVMMQFDNQKVSESIGFSLIEALICAFIGFFIGLTIGVFDFGALAGAGVGFLAMLFSIAFFVLLFGGDGNHQYIFRNNWRVLLAFLTLPTVLTGLFTALVKSLIFEAR